ncbi:PAS domain S-box protein [Thermodesulfobacteriota bacterium]
MIDENVSHEELKQQIANLTQEVERYAKAEKALKKNEERFRRLFEQSNDAVFIHRLGSILDVNQAACDLLGYSKEQLVGMPVNDLRPDSERPDVMEKIQYVSKGDSILFEADFLNSAGAMVPVEVSSSIVDYENETIQGIVRDITARKIAEKELRENEERYRILFDHAGFSMVLVDAETGERVMFNKWAYETLGYTAEEYKNLITEEIDALENREEVLNHFKEIIEKGSDIFETVHRTKDGSSRDILISAVPVLIDGRYFIHSIGIDITERKLGEEEKVRMELRLKQAQKMEALGTMAGGFAHDFNNILTPMILHSELLLMDAPAGTPQRFSIDEILNSGKRARELVKRIMTFSRQRIHKRVNLRAGSIVKETLKLLRASLPSSIYIQQNIEAETSEVFADPTLIHQLLINLCNNAAYAMREKGGTICVDLKDVKTDLNGDLKSGGQGPEIYLKLTVSDTGYGMESDVLERIFEPYFTTKENGEVSGMGLSMVHGIVTSYEGKINVESTPGKGTTVELFIPAVVKERIPEADENILVPKGNERLFFLDDEVAVVNAVKPGLERLGYNVVAGTDSIKSIELLRKEIEKFDMILTDYTMPEMTGIAFAEEIKSIRHDIPVILCTGHGEIIDKGKAKQAGVLDIISKPVRLSEIAAVIRSAFDNKCSRENADG